jgi:hypothetical protein
MLGEPACRLDLLNFVPKEEAAALALTFVEMEIACKSWRSARSKLRAACLLCPNGPGGRWGWSAWVNGPEPPADLEAGSCGSTWSPASSGVASGVPPLSEPLTLRDEDLEERGIGHRQRPDQNLERLGGFATGAAALRPSARVVMKVYSTDAAANYLHRGEFHPKEAHMGPAERVKIIERIAALALAALVAALVIMTLLP